MKKTGYTNIRRSYNGPVLQSLVKHGSQERSLKGPKCMASAGSSSDMYAEKKSDYSNKASFHNEQTTPKSATENAMQGRFFSAMDEDVDL